jgi:hypothetical protein
MARAFNCPELVTDPQGAVATRFVASRLKGTESWTTQEKLVALQDGLVEQEQTCFFGFRPFEEDDGIERGTGT